MNIVWHYLDKKLAAINALKDFSNMVYIIEHTAEELAITYEAIESPRISSLSGLPRVHNPKGTEEHLAASIDEIDVLRERYRQALAYMEWFKPAWNALNEEERNILNAFFVQDIAKSEAIQVISEQLHMERSWVYKKKEDALRQLTLLLYGI